MDHFVYFGYSDTPLIVTVCSGPEGVTISGLHCSAAASSWPKN